MCTILHHVISGFGGAGSGRAFAQCVDHGLSDFVPLTTAQDGETYCPIGRIELAVAEGLAKIAAATSIKDHGEQ